MYGMALTNPIIQPFLAQSPSLATGPQSGGLSGIPRAAPKVRLAPLEPVYIIRTPSRYTRTESWLLTWSHPWMAAAMEFMMMV